MYYCKNCDKKVEDQYRLSCSRCPYCKKFMCRATPEDIVVSKNRAMLELMDKWNNLTPEQRQKLALELQDELLQQIFSRH